MSSFKSLFVRFLITVSLGSAVAAHAEVITTQGNRITPLRDGHALNNKRLELIDKAEKFIYLKTFIINRDASEGPVFRALCDKSMAGVDVRMLVDDIGGYQGGNPLKAHKGDFSVEWFKSCRIRFEEFANAKWGPVAFALYNQHDKMLVTENGAIMGGTNYSRDYSAHGQLSPRWYDFDIAIQGPGVCGLQTIFNNSWKAAYNKEAGLILPPRLNNSELDARYSPTTLEERCYHPEAAGPTEITSIYNNPYESKDRPLETYVLNSIDAVMSHALDRSIILYAPYFVPSEKIRDKLIQAAQNGVRVRVLTNSSTSIDPEAFASYVATLMRVKELIASGVEIYMWHPSGVAGSPLAKDNVFHKKGGCFGELSCYVGSHNLDVRGDEFSSELMSVISDADFMASQMTSYEDDMRYSERLDEPLREKLLGEAKLRHKAVAKVGGWLL